MKFEFEIQGKYGKKWEMVCTEETKEEAIAQLKCYNENEPNYAHRIKKIAIKDLKTEFDQMAKILNKSKEVIE